MAAGHGQRTVCSVRAIKILSTCCAKGRISGKRGRLVVKARLNEEVGANWYPKSGRAQSFLTRLTYRGEALKGRSEGSWRSGRRRSEGGWRRGTGNVLCVPCGPFRY